MENREIAIQLSGVKKMYKLGQIGGGTLTADLQSWWARVRGKEDPNSKIGQEQRLVGQTFMALNGIDLTIYKGEALGIIGGNGAGKSTMLKLLSRVTAPTEGEIGINGRITSMLEVGTGFNPEMTGRENVYMNGAILGMTKAEIDAKMEEIIEFSEVRDFIDTPVKRYTSGMFVKLAFSVAAHLDSEIMIMDEVLAVGDVNFQQKCLKKMRDVAMQEGRTVLYVSHNMSTIRQLCSRCIVLDSGQCIFNGDVEQAISIYEQNKAFSIDNEYDLSHKPRISGITENCRMEHVQLEMPNVKMSQELVFQLTISSGKEVQDAMIRFVLFDRKGTAIGAVYSDRWMLSHGKSCTRFCLDTKVLAPGEYTADMILISYDGERQIRHDVVTSAFCFEVMEDTLFYNMKWNKNGWGSVRLPALRIKE